MEERERCFCYTTTLVVTDPSPEKQGTPEPAASSRHLEISWTETQLWWLPGREPVHFLVESPGEIL